MTGHADSRMYNDFFPREGNVMKLALAVAICLALAVVLTAQERTEFGPFSAITIDRGVVEDVEVDGNDIFVKVVPEHRQATFAVKISNAKSDGYRSWDGGQNEMEVKVYQSQQRNRLGYTYRVNTAASFIEYWTNGKLVLHLERN